MMLRLLSLSWLIVLAGASHALGADAVTAAADPAPFDWSGPRAGIYAGYGSLDGQGALTGASIGYDWRFGDVVVGVDGGLLASGMDGRRDGGRYEVEAVGEIRARIGYAFDRFMAYGAVGAAFAATDYVRAGRRDSAFQAGWLVGAGVEVRLFDRVSATAEYVYVDLDRKTFNAGGDVGLDAAGGQVRVGLNYRF
ncbi:outer membrane protein [Methylopila sp. Yamaguchi]|uniref:outer membrane protein n=1 Tax=Methylopila sp. Yamaguchi TaxID=1437817 RepID=UPI000CCBDAED|nr:outer membrane beta-barrel protein [Methylopila sp. Yamaguchi]